MYDFATDIVPEIVKVVSAISAIVDPTTFIGGLVAASLGGAIGFRLVRRLFRLAR